MSAWVSGAGAVIGGVVAANGASSASDSAAGAQKDALAQQQLAMQQIMNMLKPYRKAGVAGLEAQLNLLGLNGDKKQQTSISALEASPYFTSQVKAGENALRQNAAATGGLRGGNTAAALAQFRPQMLAQTIENQYGKLAALSAAGQNAATNTGVATEGYNSNIASIMGNIGNIQAQGGMAQSAALSNMIGGLANAYGAYQGQNNANNLLSGSNAGLSGSFAPQTTSDGSYWNLGAGS